MDWRQARIAGMIGGGALLAGGLYLAFAPSSGPDTKAPGVVASAPPGVEKAASEESIASDEAQKALAMPALKATVASKGPVVEAAGAAETPKAAVKSEPAPKAAAKPKSQSPITPAKTPSTENPNLEFIVRVKDGHPLFRAQTLHEQGKPAEAAAEARDVLARTAQLRGFCFEGFTLGSEIVLAACTAAPPGKSQTVSAQMVRRLKAMRATVYAEENIIVRQEDTRAR